MFCAFPDSMGQRPKSGCLCTAVTSPLLSETVSHRSPGCGDPGEPGAPGWVPSFPGRCQRGPPARNALPSSGRPPPTHPASPPCPNWCNCPLLESSVLFFFIQQLLMEPKLFPCRGLCTGWSLGLGLLAPSSAPDSVAVSAEAAPPPTPLIAPSFSPYPSFF